MAVQCVRQCIRSGGSPDRREDTEGQSSVASQHSSHFMQRHAFVREKLQSELAEYQVEGVVRERQCQRAALLPLYLQPCVCRKRPGDGQHCGADVNTNDPSLAHARSSDACDDPRAAGEIQHAPACARAYPNVNGFTFLLTLRSTERIARPRNQSPLLCCG